MKQIKFKSLLLMILAFLLPVTAAAYDVQVDGIYYNFDGNNAIVTYGENNYRGDIVIPERIINNGIEYIVSSIGNAAFYWCSELTSVVLSDSIKSIGNSAFHKCEALTTIIIPNSVTTIDNAAFGGCKMLKSAFIPNSIAAIGYAAFAECPLLDDVYCAIEDPSIITMGADVFYLSSGNYSFRTLHVPAESLILYRVDNKWIKYFNNIVEIESNPSTNIKGDVNEDGVVNISDVTALIDYLLSGMW